MEDNDTPQKRKAHLTRNQRMSIEAMLNKGLSFYEIAKAVNLHHSTISREVKSRRREENIGARGMTLNRCIVRNVTDDRYAWTERIAFGDAVPALGAILVALSSKRSGVFII